MSRPSSPLEKVIEEKIGDYAKSKGCLWYKFTSPNQRAVPDRLVIAPGKPPAFLEIKRGGHKPTPLQLREMDKLHLQGCSVGWVDNVADGKKFIDQLLKGDTWI